MMGALLALALALPLVPAPSPDPRPTIPVMRVYLPVLANVPAWLSAPTRAPDLRTVLRPADAGGLAAALQVPGALVLPEPGIYKRGGYFRVAAGVSLNGRGAVTIRGGLLLQAANGATIRGVRIDRATEDAISIVKTGGHVLIEGVRLSGAGDGCLDVVRSDQFGLVVTVRDSVLSGCRKAMLLGHYDPGLDAALRVHLERVTFEDCDARTPKVHRAYVTVTDGRVINWGSRAVDVQLSGRVVLVRVRFDEGAHSGPRIRLETGGAVDEAGTVFIPYRPTVGLE